MAIFFYHRRCLRLVSRNGGHARDLHICQVNAPILAAAFPRLFGQHMVNECILQLPVWVLQCQQLPALIAQFPNGVLQLKMLNEGERMWKIRFPKNLQSLNELFLLKFAYLQLGPKFGLRRQNVFLGQIVPIVGFHVPIDEQTGAAGNRQACGLRISLQHGHENRVNPQSQPNRRRNRRCRWAVRPAPTPPPASVPCTV